MSNVLVIYNPFAGGGSALTVLEKYKRYALTQTSTNFTYYGTTKPRDEEGIRKAIIGCNPTVISIIGGDGTINDVINVQEARSKTLHLVPAGSGNDFQRLIHGDIDLIENIKLCLLDSKQSYDVGKCNDRFFLNGVGIGFDGSVARETVQMKLPFISTKWKYWVAILKNVFFYKSALITITESGISKTKKRFMVAIANGTDYGGGFKISPESEASDNWLNLVSIGAIQPFIRLFKIPKVQNGNHLSEDYVEHFKTQKVTVSSESMLHAHLDGELMSANCFDISIQPQVSFVVL